MSAPSFSNLHSVTTFPVSTSTWWTPLECSAPASPGLNSSMSVSPLISIRFILNTVADITNIDTWLKREDKQEASKTTPV
jgi:hypothetical protein